MGRRSGSPEGFVRALAVELARYKIRVNSILPGWIVSETTPRFILDNQRSADAVLLRNFHAALWRREGFGGIAVFQALLRPPILRANNSSSVAATPNSEWRAGRPMAQKYGARRRQNAQPC